MHKIFITICVCLFVKAVYSGIALQPPIDPPPEFAGQPGCYSEQFRRMIPLYESFSPQDGSICVQHTCVEEGYTEIMTCEYETNPSCTETEGDILQPFPACCPQYTCPPLTL